MILFFCWLGMVYGSMNILVLFSIIAGLLFGVIAWGVWRIKGQDIGSDWTRPRDDVLLGLLVLAAFAIGVFLTYALLGPGS
jgi:hypothetical protein